MIRSMNPFTTSAFNRSVIAAPPMTPEEIRRREQVEDVLEHWKQEHRDSLQCARGIFNAIVFTLCAAAAIFAWCCL